MKEMAVEQKRDVNDENLVAPVFEASFKGTFSNIHDSSKL